MSLKFKKEALKKARKLSFGDRNQLMKKIIDYKNKNPNEKIIVKDIEKIKKRR